MTVKTFTTDNERTERPDLDLLCRVAYGEYQVLTPEQRRRSRWIMTPDMWAWIRVLASVSLCGPASESLLGRPVELRDDAEGIRLEVAA